jgi:hypothetical protein
MSRDCRVHSYHPVHTTSITLVDALLDFLHQIHRLMTLQSSNAVGPMELWTSRWNVDLNESPKAIPGARECRCISAKLGSSGECEYHLTLDQLAHIVAASPNLRVLELTSIILHPSQAYHDDIFGNAASASPEIPNAL